MLNKLLFIKIPCVSTSQDNCSEVGVLVDTQSTNETSVRVARNNNGSLTRQDTEVLIQPAACPLVRTITMEYVSKQSLCVLLEQILQKHFGLLTNNHIQVIKSPWTCPIDKTKG